MKEKFMRFMMGRYGMDFLGRCIIITGLVAIVLASLFDSSALSTLAWVLVIFSYFRMFSKNIYKRSSENQMFLNKTSKLRSWFAAQKKQFSQRNMYRFYTCPTCRQKIRVPKGKGKIEVRCPKCNTRFVKTS